MQLLNGNLSFSLLSDTLLGIAGEGRGRGGNDILPCDAEVLPQSWTGEQFQFEVASLFLRN